MNITIFSKPNCVPCANLKTWLKAKQIEYTEASLMDNIEKLAGMGFTAAPVVLINDTYVSGVPITNVSDVLRREGASI